MDRITEDLYQTFISDWTFWGQDKRLHSRLSENQTHTHASIILVYKQNGCHGDISHRVSPKDLSLQIEKNEHRSRSRMENFSLMRNKIIYYYYCYYCS